MGLPMLYILLNDIYEFFRSPHSKNYTKIKDFDNF